MVTAEFTNDADRHPAPTVVVVVVVVVSSTHRFRPQRYAEGVAIDVDGLKAGKGSKKRG
jgi:hypothetical protein